MFLRNVLRGDNPWWAYLMTILIVIGAYILGQLPLGLAYYSQLKQNSPTASEEELLEIMEVADFAGAGMDLNWILFLFLLSFVAAFFALRFSVQFLHKRNWQSLITPKKAINWRKIGFAFLLWIGMTFVLEGIGYFYEDPAYIWQFQWDRFLILVLISFTLLPIQTSTEELFFRGYLMQGISLLSRFRIVPLVLTSVLFGIIHMTNPEVYKFGWLPMMTYYIGVGFFLGLITLLDDSLELALGVHAATNIYSAVLVSYEGGALETHAIYKTTVVNIELMLPITFVMAAIFMFICWRKYRWEGWHKAFGTTEVVV